jgi:hypothetical protein
VARDDFVPETQVSSDDSSSGSDSQGGTRWALTQIRSPDFYSRVAHPITHTGPTKN